MAAGVRYAWVSGHWPLDLLGPPGNHLHPVALFGHALALGVAFTLVLEGLRLRPRRAELKTCEDRSQPHWAAGYVKNKDGQVVRAREEAHDWKHGAGALRLLGMTSRR